MGTYVLELGPFAFGNWWQVGLAFSFAISYVLFNLIPYVCMTAMGVFGKRPDFDDPVAVQCAILPLLGIMVDLIFWDKVKPMLYVGCCLVAVMVLCFIGSVLCAAGVI